MRTIFALLLLSVSAVAQDFSWAITDDPFLWSVTERAGDLQSLLNDSAVRVTDDPSQVVHQITVGNPQSGGVGSATYIGDGVFLTCRHVFARQWNAVKIDGRPVEAKANAAEGPDFAVVRVEPAHGAAARVNTSPLSDGQSLRVVGQKTGLHAGVLSPKRWSHGYRAVVCSVPTESGDSGAGVFNDAGELVGVHWGSTGYEVFFTPLSEVADMLPSRGSDVPAVSTPVVASEPNTSVCPCRGSNRGVCHCLARGVTCRCSANVGSEWEMAGNKPVNKTGRYLDPNQAVAVNNTAAPVSPAEGRLSDKPQPGFECKQYSDGRWYWNDGSGWRVTSVQPTDGQRFTGGGKSFVYRSGRMHDAPKMVVEIKPAPQRKGRWVCRGGYCEWVWQ